MSIARVNTDYLTGAADAIRRKIGSQNPIPLTQFENEIDNIPTATLIGKTITQNGTYNAQSDNADGYDVVTVDVPEKNTLDELFANTLEVANIPSATHLFDRMFSGNTDLVNVIMPNVTSISPFAFNGCSSLAITTIPSGVTSIGSYAFRGCSNISYLDFSDFTGIPTVTSSSFFLTTFPFYFRDQQQLDEWAAATNWSTYADRFQIKPSGVI